MGRSQREKGKRGEREVVSLFKVFGGEARRLAPAQTSNIRISGYREAGIADQPDVRGELNGLTFDIEVKRRKALPKFVTGAMEQAKEAGVGVPMVAMREDGGEWLALVNMSWLLEVLNDKVDTG